MLMNGVGESNEPGDEVELLLERLPGLSSDFCEAAFESHYTESWGAAESIVELCGNDYEFAKSTLSELIDLLNSVPETEAARRQFWTTATKVCNRHFPDQIKRELPMNLSRCKCRAAFTDSGKTVGISIRETHFVSAGDLRDSELG